MPNYQKARAEALQQEAMDLYEQAKAAPSDSERAQLERLAQQKEREADKVESGGR